jgi:hypothetical protein
MVERLTVNQYVVGSSPTSGANLWCEKLTASCRRVRCLKRIEVQLLLTPQFNKEACLAGYVLELTHPVEFFYCTGR